MTITLPIGATADTLKRCIYRALPTIDPAIFDRAQSAADVLLALNQAREDIQVRWE